MNKFHIISFIAILAIFVGILSATQGESLKNVMPGAVTPVLPNEADTFQLISPAQKEVQGQQQGPESQTKQTDNAPVFGVEEGVKASYSATIRTTKGNIKILIDGRAAPRTVKNFLSKVESGFYKNLKFHRVEDWVIQGGDPKGNGTGGNLMVTEINPLPFVTGSVGMAGIKNNKGENISNDSQFFITKSDAPWLNQQYTNFGLVMEGMDVVNNMQIGDKILSITVQ